MPVANNSELRPTPDRVRETLFNWLQPVIDGSECLDLFAGTGVLGCEALSRGASHVCLVEQNDTAVRQLRDNLDMLQAGEAELEQAEGLSWIARTGRQFDIVFIDPPFGKGLVEKSCDELVAHRRLKPGALLYVEVGADVQLPRGLETVRRKKAGQVQYMLLKYSDEQSVVSDE